MIISEDTLIEERVKRGVELLNENRPGWFNEIDLETFCIEDSDNCILAQLYGDYCDTPLGIENYEDFYGFSLFNIDPYDPRWNLLQNCWVETIKSLQMSRCLV